MAELLERTLAFAAAEVPFYQGRVDSAGGLSAFPLIDRATVQEDPSAFLAGRHFPDYLVMSGGTTGHVVNATFRTDDEYDAVYELLTGRSASEPLALDEIDSFGLDIFFNTNGYIRRKTRGAPLLSIPLERLVHVELITRLLRDGFTIGGRRLPAASLQCQNALHRVLAGYYGLTEPPDCAELAHVFGYGAHVTRVWGERLHSLWGRPISTAYGLSEFAGANAVRCSSCASLHYVTAWQEFLSPVDGSPVERGDAVLVLTSLLPYVSFQPRIRYVTHDIVTCAGVCPDSGLMGFRFRGREQSSAWIPVGDEARVVLSEVDVLEALDQLAGLDDVATKRHPAEIQLWEDASLPPPPFRIGLPQFRVEGGDLSLSGVLRVRVEAGFDPTTYGDRADELSRRMTALILAESDMLPALIDSGSVDFGVELVAPGALRVPVKTSA